MFNVFLRQLSPQTPPSPSSCSCNVTPSVQSIRWLRGLVAALMKMTSVIMQCNPYSKPTLVGVAWHQNTKHGFHARPSSNRVWHTRALSVHEYHLLKGLLMLIRFEYFATALLWNPLCQHVMGKWGKKEKHTVDAWELPKINI